MSSISENIVLPHCVRYTVIYINTESTVYCMHTLYATVTRSELHVHYFATLFILQSF